MKKSYTCVACGKKFWDDLPDSVAKAVKFSMCLECGKIHDEIEYRRSN